MLDIDAALLDVMLRREIFAQQALKFGVLVHQELAEVSPLGAAWAR